MIDNHSKTIFVIGSGPAGVSAAHALLNRGVSVVMLDVGISLDKNIQENLDYFKQTLDENILSHFKSELNTADHVKLIYGSDYVYKQPPLIRLVTDNEAFCQPSYAKGGLSNAWGAFVSEYDAKDMTGWPIPAENLSSYYQKILEFMPIAHNRAHYGKFANHYESSRQATFLLNQFNHRRDSLSKVGLKYGAAKLAVQFDSKAKPSCTYCGLCQYGCPHSVIYSSAATLKDLKAHPQFSYIEKIFVNSFTEKKDALIIHALHVETKEEITWEASRVFLAAGAVSSTQLLLNTLKISTPIVIQDSQHFMFPCLMYKKIKNLSQEKLHALCQAYLVLTLPHVLKQSCHLQIYTYMEQYENEFKKMLGKLYPFVKFFLKPILSRMIVIQGFLHSEDSHGFSLQTDRSLSSPGSLSSPVSLSSPSFLSSPRKRGSNQMDPRFRGDDRESGDDRELGDDRKLGNDRESGGDKKDAKDIGTLVSHVKIVKKPLVNQKIKKIISHLFKHRKLLGFIPIKLFLKISKPGRSFHYGGSFPMNHQPSQLATNLLGNPYGLKRLHVVDATIFPTIPAQSITFSIMANAYRIASECHLNENL